MRRTDQRDERYPVAPKERVNLTRNDGEELPLKVLVMGDFTLGEDPRPLDARAPTLVDATTFEAVLAAHRPTLDLPVAEGLPFSRMRDFTPDGLVERLSATRPDVEARTGLHVVRQILQGYPEFRKRINQVLASEAARRSVASEIVREERRRAVRARVDQPELVERITSRFSLELRPRGWQQPLIVERWEHRDVFVRYGRLRGAPDEASRAWLLACVEGEPRFARDLDDEGRAIFPSQLWAVASHTLLVDAAYAPEFPPSLTLNRARCIALLDELGAVRASLRVAPAAPWIIRSDTLLVLSWSLDRRGGIAAPLALLAFDVGTGRLSRRDELTVPGIASNFSWDGIGPLGYDISLALDGEALTARALAWPGDGVRAEFRWPLDERGVPGAMDARIR